MAVITLNLVHNDDGSKRQAVPAHVSETHYRALICTILMSGYDC
jgi:hypothetical protein